jgi:hypothetical protein
MLLRVILQHHIEYCLPLDLVPPAFCRLHPASETPWDTLLAIAVFPPVGLCLHLLSAPGTNDLLVRAATNAVLWPPLPGSQLLVLFPRRSLLQYLRAIGQALAPLGPQVVLYLAAAVSDFYLPWSELVGALMHMHIRICSRQHCSIPVNAVAYTATPSSYNRQRGSAPPIFPKKKKSSYNVESLHRHTRAATCWGFLAAKGGG